MSTPDRVDEAFDPDAARPAVFHRRRRTALDVWRLDQEVPVADAVERFRGTDGFETDDGTVVVPIHEPETTETTGEYLLYEPDNDAFVFYDAGRGGLVRLPREAAARTYPGWRVRLWAETDATPGGAERAAADPTSTTPAPDAATGGDDDSAHAAADGPVANGAGTAPGPGPGDGAAGPPAVRDRDTTDGDVAALYEEVFSGGSTVAAEGEERDEEFFEELRLFVEREREAARTAARQRFRSIEPGEYHATFGGIPAAETRGKDVDQYGQQVVVFDVAREELPPGGATVTEAFGIHGGSEVILAPVGGGDGFPVEGEVLSVAERRLEVGVYWDRTDAKGRVEAALTADTDRRFRIGELVNPVPYDRRLDGIDAVAGSERKRRVVTGAADLAFAPEAAVTVPDAQLDGHQADAVRSALAAEDVYCIHGPPGTGKTRTLRRLVTATVADHGRVLACAHSNQAVDNLLVGESTADNPDGDSLHRAALDGDLDLDIARAGDNSENPVVQEHYDDADVWQADVVGATTSAAHQFADDEFDLVVVDEATQATIPATLIPLAKASTAILAGDHRQLPPYHSTETSDEEDLEPSLFEHLLTTYGADVATMLRTQYRMHEAIAAFPNRAFYGGDLDHGGANRDWTIGDRPAVEGVQVDGEERATPADSYCNEQEAKAVGREVSNLLFAGVQPDDIGVITAYSGQIGKIRSRLQDLTDLASVDRVAVDTVDSFQGSQREAVVVSFVRANPAGHTGFLTFPEEGPRRLNVALTRARKRLVLVGDWETLGTRAPNRDAPDSCADLYADLEQFLRNRGAIRRFPEG